MENYKLKRARKLRESGELNKPFVNYLIPLGELTDFEKDDYSINEHGEIKWNESRIKAKADDFLNSLGKEYHSKKKDTLFDDLKEDVKETLITTFGIGKIISAFDKEGGNVDTTHNASNGIYASEEERQKFETEQGNYDSRDYHEKNADYKKKREEKDKIDCYTGESLDNTNADTEHITSAKEIHTDPGLILAGANRIEIANSPENLGHTNRTVNRSKGDDNTEDFLKKIEEAKKRQDDYKGRDDLTDAEKERSRKDKELLKVDEQRVEECSARSREKIKKEENKYYTSPKFIIKAGKESLKEGVKMGFQQFVGLLMKEFFEAAIPEIKKHIGDNSKSVLEKLKEGLQNIWKKISAKWKKYIKAFKDGAISGFFSNIITTVVNIFKTTSKNVVRMIREGFFSLVKALKFLFFPPEGMSAAEARHESSKLFFGGIVVIGAIALEESLGKILSPFLAQILIAIISSIVTVIGMYLLDKLDLFNADKEKQNKFIDAALQKKTEELYEKYKSIGIDLA